MKIGRETRSGELLLEIILRRHEVRSTIMTSNRPVEEWEQAAGRRSRRPAACVPQSR